jgi:hypothetical protein
LDESFAFLVKIYLFSGFFPATAIVCSAQLLLIQIERHLLVAVRPTKYSHVATPGIEFRYTACGGPPASFTVRYSISASPPNGTASPSRNPGAQAVAGRETKSEQDCYVRQHRMFPQATRRQLAIVVPNQFVLIPAFPNSRQRPDNTVCRSASKVARSYPSSERYCLWSDPAAPLFGHHSWYVSHFVANLSQYQPSPLSGRTKGNFGIRR